MPALNDLAPDAKAAMENKALVEALRSSRMFRDYGSVFTKATGLPLVSVGPERDAALAAELRRRGVDVRGFVAKGELVELYRTAACLVFPTRYEGFGLPVAEAMASGTPVVATPDAAVKEVGGDAIVYARPEDFADAIRSTLAERDRWVRAGLERARLFSWEETARKTVEVYREAL